MEPETMEAVRTLVDFAESHSEEIYLTDAVDDDEQTAGAHQNFSDLMEAVQTVLKYLDGDDYLSPEEIQACREQDEEQAEAAGDCKRIHDHTLQGGAYCD